MDKGTFINLIKSEVADSAVESTIDNLVDPPGRNPSSEMLALSQWYDSLPNEGKANVHKIITDAVKESIFGFLCVLDDVRSISESGERNNLELYHLDNETKIQLNDEVGEYLHDVFNRT